MGVLDTRLLREPHAREHVKVRPRLLSSTGGSLGSGMTEHPEVACEPFTGAQIRIGVMGSAGDPLEPVVAALCRRLGRAIAERGCCLLTGACPGLPHEAVLGAKGVEGHVVGISPASSLQEHIEAFGSPYRECDVLIFTGLGLMGRELVNIRSSDIVVVMAGGRARSASSPLRTRKAS